MADYPSDILTFNALIYEASRLKVRMERLWQDNDGFWFCIWRKNGVISEAVQRRQPFTAMHDSFVKFVAEIDAKNSPATSAASDLLG